MGKSSDYLTNFLLEILIRLNLHHQQRATVVSMVRINVQAQHG